MVVHHRHKRVRQVLPSSSKVTVEFRPDAEGGSRFVRLATAEEEVRRLCSFRYDKPGQGYFDDLESIVNLIVKIRSVLVGDLTFADCGDDCCHTDDHRDTDDLRMPSFPLTGGNIIPNTQAKDSAINIHYSERFVAAMDVKLVKQTHGFLIHLLSHTSSLYATSTEQDPDSLNYKQSTHHVLKCIIQTCKTLDVLYRSRLIPDNVNNDKRRLLSIMECQEVFDASVRMLELSSLIETVEGDDTSCETDDEARDDSEICDTENKIMHLVVSAKSSCLGVLNQLGPHIQSAKMTSFKTIVDPGCRMNGLLQLTRGLLESLAKSSDLQTSQIASIAVAAMIDADKKSSLNSSPPMTNEPIFQTYCFLLMRTTTLTENAFVAIIDHLDNASRQSFPDSHLSADCMELLCAKFLRIQNTREQSHDRIIQAMRRLFQRTRYETRRVLPALKWCRRNNLLALLVDDPVECTPKRLIACLLAFLMDQQKSKGLPKSLGLIRLRLQEYTAAEVLLSIMTMLFDDSGVRANTHCNSILESIPGTDLVSICTVLMEHDNLALVRVATVWLCDKLANASHELLIQVPNSLASLGAVALDLLRNDWQLELIGTIVTLWNKLAARMDSTVSALLTRQSSVISALLQIVSQDSVPDAARLAATHVLVLLSHDVCNRRMLACHNGLLPGLIRATREFHFESAGLNGVPIELTRDSVKMCIMNLAVAL